MSNLIQRTLHKNLLTKQKTISKLPTSPIINQQISFTPSFLYVDDPITTNDSTRTDLFLLDVEVFNDDTNEEIESEERSEDDEEDKVEVHSRPDLEHWLSLRLRGW